MENHFKGFTVEYIERNKKHQSRWSSKSRISQHANACGCILPSHGIEASVNTDELEPKLINIIEEEDCQAPIMTYFHHYYELDSINEQTRMQQWAKAYQIIDNDLYKASVSGPLLQCLSKVEGQELLSEVYAGVCRGHIGVIGGLDYDGGGGVACGVVIVGGGLLVGGVEGGLDCDGGGDCGGGVAGGLTTGGDGWLVGGVVVGGLYCGGGAVAGEVLIGGVCKFVGGVAGGLDCDGGGDVAEGLTTGGGSWLVGGMVGGVYCDGGGDCVGGVTGGLATGGGGWLVGGVVGGLYYEGGGDCGGGAT
jgi:hypothetical protein